MSVLVLAALATAAAAFLLAIIALVNANRAGHELEALHERFDNEVDQLRTTVTALTHRADEAFERASQPSIPGEAALKLQAAAEGIEDARNEIQRLQKMLKREGEQRLSTEISLFDALDKVRTAATEPPAPAVPPRRARRSDSVFEIVDFGDELGQENG